MNNLASHTSQNVLIPVRVVLKSVSLYLWILQKKRRSFQILLGFPVQRRGLASRIPILSKSDVAVQYRNSQRKLRSISEDFSEGSFLVVNELKDPDTEPPFSRSREGSLGR